MAKKIDYASLYTLRKDGRYQGHYRDKNGKRQTVYSRDPEELYFKIQDILDNLDGPLTFGKLAQAWHDAQWEKIDDGTQASYAAHYTRAVERFGSRLAESLTPNDIDTHLKELQAQGYSASTISKQRTIYRLIFYFAIVHEHYGKIIKSDPSQHVKIPRGTPKPKKREAPEDEIVQRIQDCASTAYFGDYVMFLICTGFRRGEALSIRWCDIDWQKEEIVCNRSLSLRGCRGVFKDPKTDNGIRRVPILPPLRPFLEMPEDAAPTDYLFHGDDPSLPMAKSAYGRKWLHYCKEMGFVEDFPEKTVGKNGRTYIRHNYKPTLTAHVLRHGYATMLFEAEVDELTAQILMGHSDISITREIYTHLRNRKKQTSVDKLKQYTAHGISGL